MPSSRGVRGGGRQTQKGGWGGGRWPWGLRVTQVHVQDINVILLTQVSEIHVLDSELPGLAMSWSRMPDSVWAEMMSSLRPCHWAPRQGDGPSQVPTVEFLREGFHTAPVVRQPTSTLLDAHPGPGNWPAGWISVSQAGYRLCPLCGPRSLPPPLLLVIRGLSAMGIQHVQHEPLAGEDVATLLIYTGILNTRGPQT